MKTASVADLRNDFARLEKWLEAGEKVQITKRGIPVAKLTSWKEPRSSKKVIWPDIMARLERTWGNRVFSEAEVREMRNAEHGDRA